MNILQRAIVSLRAGADWELTGSANSYSDLVWNDEVQTKPTQEEVEAMINELQNLE